MSEEIKDPEVGEHESQPVVIDQKKASVFQRLIRNRLAVVLAGLATSGVAANFAIEDYRDRNFDFPTRYDGYLSSGAGLFGTPTSSNSTGGNELITKRLSLEEQKRLVKLETGNWDLRARNNLLEPHKIHATWMDEAIVDDDCAYTSECPRSLSFEYEDEDLYREREKQEFLRKHPGYKEKHRK